MATTGAPLAIAAACFSALSALADTPRLVAFGGSTAQDWSWVASLSSDGLVAAGSFATQSSSAAFAWEVRGSQSTITPLTSVSASTYAGCVSGNGARVFGSLAWTAAGYHAVLSSWAAPSWGESYGGLGEDGSAFAPPSIVLGGASMDGNIVAGSIQTEYLPTAYRWTISPRNRVQLPMLPSLNLASCSGVSGDGLIMAGYGASISTPSQRTAALWRVQADSSITVQPLDGPAGSTTWQASAVSRNGRWVGGNFLDGTTTRAVMWNISEANTGPPQDLGLPTGWSSVRIFALSGDGSAAVGAFTTPGTDTSDLGFLWRWDSGFVTLHDAAVQAGVSLPGWTLSDPLAISDDGLVIGGHGRHDFAPGLHRDEAFILILRRCGTSDFNHDGDAATDADIEAFFACLAGNCCPTCGSADFNGDGDSGTDADIEAFFRVLAGGAC